MNSPASIVVIGEILWDVFTDSERLGGAPFNSSVHARRLGHPVTFISAVGDDERGIEARRCAAAFGLDPDFIQIVPELPTGMVSVSVDEAGLPDFTIHRPAAYDRVRLDQPGLRTLAALSPDWIYYGTLHQMEPQVRSAIRQLIETFPNAKRFYDVNLRRNSYSAELVRQLMAVSSVVKLNEDEVTAVEQMSGGRSNSLEQFTGSWSKRLGWRAVAVTRGKDGCAVRIGDDYAEAPGRSVVVADTVGAGDAFAAAFLHGLSQNWSALRTADFANRLGALVAGRAGALPEWTLDELWNLA
jgi:fructokinase